MRSTIRCRMECVGWNVYWVVRECGKKAKLMRTPLRMIGSNERSCENVSAGSVGRASATVHASSHGYPDLALSDAPRSAGADGGPARAGLVFRRTLVLTLTWLLVSAAYFAVFATSDPAGTFSWNLQNALLNATTGALLGIGVLALCDALAWPIRHRVRFAIVQAMLAAAYSSAWLLLISFALTVQRGVNEGEWSWTPLSGPAVPWQLLQGVAVYGLLAGLSYAWRAASLLSSQREKVALAEALRSRAELHALRLQLNPHFLFNALHSMQSLVRQNPAAAERGLEQLGDLLRATLLDKELDDVPLQEELALVRTYLEIERLRFGDRLRFEARIDPSLDHLLLPGMTLQPIVENAVKYAVATRTSGGSIAIVGSVESDCAVLVVTDDGPGATAASPGAELGLKLVRQRLEARFPGQASLVATARVDGFSVRIGVPMNNGPGQAG